LEGVPLYVLAAGVELQSGNLDLARAFCAKAFQMDPKFVSLYVNWAKTEELFGNPSRARRLYEEGLRVQPFNAPLLLVRVVICAPLASLPLG
jgi:tetratricopeptide (TPR) repeat protein